MSKGTPKIKTPSPINRTPAKVPENKGMDRAFRQAIKTMKPAKERQ